MEPLCHSHQDMPTEYLFGMIFPKKHRFKRLVEVELVALHFGTARPAQKPIVGGKDAMTVDPGRMVIKSSTLQSGASSITLLAACLASAALARAA